MQEPTPLTGRVVALRPPGPGGANVATWQLARGPLTVRVVIDGLPIGDLPAGSRLRIGSAVLVELARPGVAVPWDPVDSGGFIEAGQHEPVSVEVLDGGPVKPGDPVALEAVTLPLTDVLDLHSFRPEDTRKVLREYLGEAYRAGLEEVRIVHGRGRGVQRAMIRRMLTEVPQVARFADAPPTRGGWGATIVQLHRMNDAPPA
ncbi:MAG TPA: Smr/MutS family protein [Methylomirabilota bacterium]|nr:Smr/MutS family protein [Methylomirabilota bacterium]